MLQSIKLLSGEKILSASSTKWILESSWWLEEVFYRICTCLNSFLLRSLCYEVETFLLCKVHLPMTIKYFMTSVTFSDGCLYRCHLNWALSCCGLLFIILWLAVKLLVEILFFHFITVVITKGQNSPKPAHGGLECFDFIYRQILSRKNNSM